MMNLAVTCLLLSIAVEEQYVAVKRGKKVIVRPDCAAESRVVRAVAFRAFSGYRLPAKTVSWEDKVKEPFELAG